MSCEEFRESVELYVAGALSSGDERRLEQHAASCSTCAAELAEWSTVTTALGHAAPAVEPLAIVRHRVMQHAARAVPGAGAARTAPSRTDWRPWLAAAALLVACAWLGYDAQRLRRSVRWLEAQLSSERARADANERRVAALQDAATLQARAVAVLTAPDVARVDLAGQPSAPAASARAYWSRSRGLVFSASALPPLPAGRTYQLWVVTARAPVSVGLLEPDRDGRAQGVYATPPDIVPVAMAVTLEPAGGVPAPTGDKFLVGVPAPTL